MPLTGNWGKGGVEFENEYGDVHLPTATGKEFATEFQQAKVLKKLLKNIEKLLKNTEIMP